MVDWSEFTGPNAAYIQDLYERYQQDPNLVDSAARTFFAANPPPVAENIPTSARVETTDLVYAAAAVRLAQAIRWYGHWAARLDPLGAVPPGDPTLDLAYYGLTEEILARLPASLIARKSQQDHPDIVGKSALDMINHLREIYCGTVGHDYLQIRVAEHRAWLREAAETKRYSVQHTPIDSVRLLDRLTQVEVFEHFLQRSFPGKTRFSIEGLDTLVPLMDEIIASAAHAGIGNILIGMAHRGRLNVLAHVLQKPYRQILAEFKDPLRRANNQSNPDSGVQMPTSWLGDVKYHAGALYLFDEDNDPATAPIHIHMAPNPSHLEAVNPVVAGMARAAGTVAAQRGPAVFDPSITLPIIIHGDAAFSGQGVVAETLNMHRLPGYTTGGTIHIIANNQLGFTTMPSESRSTLFASDVAKGYRIPVLHVNADDPEAVILAARTAYAWRAQFHRDFLIDLVGYRRLGHNEGDEPGFTQPKMYQVIQNHPTVRAIWAETLAARGEITHEKAEERYQAGLNALQKELETLIPEESLLEPIPETPPPGAARTTQTKADREMMLHIWESLLQLPEGFTIHPRLARVRQRRVDLLTALRAEHNESAAEPTLDWATAEELAIATILRDGTPVRLTGQDVERGTFSHRHAVMFDAKTGQRHIPLHQIPQANAAFEIFNSPLSEYAALGFEFGYNVQTPDRLVIWEAQYGDFINNAQTVIDEFIVSARDKWGQLPSLVLLLPHGQEGQGPDHSSARLERFLNLAAENNLRVAYPTTAANYFHLLRRQAALLELDPLPLVVMTPKSLLRNPLVASPFRDFYQGAWQPVILTETNHDAGDSSNGASGFDAYETLVVCSGKLAVDLLADLQARLALARMEQIAPFPAQEFEQVLKNLPNLKQIVWAQEEPENMGAWDYVRPYLEKLLGDRASLKIIARMRSATPAEGSSAVYAYNQKQLIEQISIAAAVGGRIHER